MKVCMTVTNGFEEMEAVGTFALLRRAGLEVDVFSILMKTNKIGSESIKFTDYLFLVFCFDKF